MVKGGGGNPVRPEIVGVVGVVAARGRAWWLLWFETPEPGGF